MTRICGLGSMIEFYLSALAVIILLVAGGENSLQERDRKTLDPGREAAMNRSLKDQAPAQGDDPVYLNHFFIVLDNQTYNEIKASKFLQEEFAAFEQRTTVRRDITYTGIYYYGANTYFEFFEPGGYNRPEGAGGIASGVEAPGASERLKQRLESHTKARAFTNTITRKAGEKDVPWFYSTAINYSAPQDKLSTWLMEYHKDFLGSWHPDLAPASRGITRREFLQRYRAKLGDVDKPNSKYLEDVVEITLALSEAEKARFIKEREAFGYKITSSENKTVYEGPGVKYMLTQSPTRASGIVEFKMSLTRDKKGEKAYRFGSRSVLRFNDDRTATWSF